MIPAAAAAAAFLPEWAAWAGKAAGADKAAGAAEAAGGIWVMQAAALLLMIAGGVMIFLSRKHQKDTSLGDDLSAAAQGCREYNALVLDVHNETEGGKKRRVIILQIRFEQQRRTVVHKCTEKFFGKYSRGQHVPVLFREGIPVDFCMLKYDNIFVTEFKNRLFYKQLLTTAGWFLVIAGAIGQIMIIGRAFLPGLF